MLSKIKAIYGSLKVNVVEAVLWAEQNLQGKAGPEKKAAVKATLENLIRLPWYLEWTDDLLLDYVVDMACEKLNWLSDWDFEAVDIDAGKLASVLEAPIPDGIVGIHAATPQGTVDKRLEELYRQYGIEPEASKPPVKPAQVPTPAPAQAIPAPPVDNWDKSISFTLKWEGGYSNHPADKGGPTNMGITQGTLKAAYGQGLVRHCGIKALAKDEAKRIYKVNFWDKYGWGGLPWPVCMCCLDICVNHGGFAFILQRACNALGAKLDVDGKYGPKTKAAVFNLGKREPTTFATEIARWRKDYYDRIISGSPSQKVFQIGWYNRLRDMAKTAGVPSPV